jgi:hypothetical protein
MSRLRLDPDFRNWYKTIAYTLNYWNLNPLIQMLN